MSDPDQWFVRALVKDTVEIGVEEETRVVHAYDEEGAKDRFKFLVESERRKVREWRGVAKRP